MKTVAIIVALLAVLGSVQAQLNYASFNGDFSSLNAPTDGLPLADLITVANYYGCKTWNKNQCVECSQSYYFNKNGVCCEVSPLCSQFNRAEGICEACYQGYSIVDGCCKIDLEDAGCAKWQGDRCVQCSKRWYQNTAGVCVPVDDNCATWNARGQCETCYGGYILQAGKCIVNPNPFTEAGNDPLCAQWQGTTCRRCAVRAYFNRNRVCTAVSDQCQTFDPVDGFCLTCYAGYTLSQGRCVESAVRGPSDLGCALWSGDLSTCLRCSERFVFSATSKTCVAVSDQCKTWTNAGACTSCYDGYDLSNGVCSVSTRRQKPSDLGCAKWDWAADCCQTCSEHWVFNAQLVCVPVSDQCATWDRQGACTKCYKGYTLSRGQCIESALERVTDIGCARWDWDNRVCLQCSKNWVRNAQRVCVPVSDQCATWDNSGACLTCYEGYVLRSGKCEEAPIQRVKDVGCARWDWRNQICLECSTSWVFNAQGVCIPVSDQCETFDKSGACVTCYVGYILRDGKCSVAPVEAVSDVGCAQWDWNRKRCLQCSERWTFNTQGVCVPVSDQCATFSSTGACLTCYTGYSLNAGRCVEDPVEKVSDVGCGLWDWAKRRCLQCSERWVFDSRGVCIPVSDQCATSNSRGECASCYVGYNLQNGKCVLAPIQKVSDVGCAEWDWVKQCCLRCSQRWFLNNDLVCVPVSDQCATFSPAGLCTSCYKGYNLNQGRCVEAPIQKVADVGCAQWDWDRQVCLRCSVNWVFDSRRVCIPVDTNCQTHSSTGQCTSCYQGYVLNSGKCEIGNSLCSQSNGSGACTECYTGYLLNNGNCVPLSKLANLALYYAKCCPERLATLSGEVGAISGH